MLNVVPELQPNSDKAHQATFFRQHSSKPLLAAVLMSRPETDYRRQVAWGFEKALALFESRLQTTKANFFKSPYVA